MTVKWTQALIDQVMALRASGLSYGKIGERMGMTKNAVIAAARRVDFPPPPRRKVRPVPNVDHEQRMAIWQRQHDGAVEALKLVKRRLTHRTENAVSNMSAGDA